MAFSVRYSMVVISMAFLLSFKSLRSRDTFSNSTSQGGRFAPIRLDPPNRPQGCRFADWKYKIVMLLFCISITAVFLKVPASRISEGKIGN